MTEVLNVETLRHRLRCDRWVEPDHDACLATGSGEVLRFTYPDITEFRRVQDDLHAATLRARRYLDDMRQAERELGILRPIARVVEYWTPEVQDPRESCRVWLLELNDFRDPKR